jgi:hypothetical protein
MRSLFRKYEVCLLAVLGGAAMWFGFWGSAIYLREDGRSGTRFWDMVYYVAQLFVLEAGLDTGKPVPWQNGSREAPPAGPTRH